MREDRIRPRTAPGRAPSWTRLAGAQFPELGLLGVAQGFAIDFLGGLAMPLA